MTETALARTRPVALVTGASGGIGLDLARLQIDIWRNWTAHGRNKLPASGSVSKPNRIKGGWRG